MTFLQIEPARRLKMRVANQPNPSRIIAQTSAKQCTATCGRCGQQTLYDSVVRKINGRRYALLWCCVCLGEPELVGIR